MKDKRKKHKPSHLHTHLWELRSKYFPRNTKAKVYRTELLRLVRSLSYAHKLSQYSSRIAIFNIHSIYQKNHYIPELSEVFEKIEDFVYHYENYCYRSYSLREKMIQFLNAILPIGYPENRVKIENIVINPIIKQSKILPLIEKFSKPTKALHQLIADRHKLTHSLYYGDKFDYYLRPTQDVEPNTYRAWLKDWEKEILKRVKQISKAEYEISEICNQLAGRITEYRYSLARYKARRLN